MRQQLLPVYVLVTLAAVAAPAVTTHALETTWIGTIGDWNDDAKWSAGEPTAEMDALIPSGWADVRLTQEGETCASLTLSAYLQVLFGSLDVLGPLTVDGGGAYYLQQGGSVATQSVELSSGMFGIQEGIFSTGKSNLRGGLFSVGPNGGFMNAGPLTVESGCNLDITGGTFLSGTDPADSAIVRGRLSYDFMPDIAFQNLAFEGGSAVFRVELRSIGLATIDVAGTLSLGGVLQVWDLGAQPGRYDLITAAAIEGTFNSFESPVGFIGASMAARSSSSRTGRWRRRACPGAS
jgi:hypothetical protein